MIQSRTAISVLLRVGGISAILAGVLFFLTVIYAFGFMPSVGFTQEMFDDRRLLLPWVADHTNVYSGLWLLYFASQVFLLPVPLALYTLIRHFGGWVSGVAAPCAVAGTTAVTMAMLGLIVIYTTSPLVAHAYVDAAPSSLDKDSVLLLGDLFADVGKEIRLFSEVLLGVWLSGTGATLVHQTRSSVVSWATLGIGGYALCVAILKILDPMNPLEDTLGLLLAMGYVGVGTQLWRRSGRVAALERIPELERPREEPHGPETRLGDPETTEGTETPTDRGQAETGVQRRERSWWRRWFGFE